MYFPVDTDTERRSQYLFAVLKMIRTFHEDQDMFCMMIEDSNVYSVIDYVYDNHSCMLTIT